MKKVYNCPDLLVKQAKHISKFESFRSQIVEKYTGTDNTICDFMPGLA
jgi:hypothetical protein